MSSIQVNDSSLHTTHVSSDGSNSLSSLYSGSNTSSVTPKSSTSLSSTSPRSLSSVQGSGDDEGLFQKPSLPAKHRTQAQTSSSSGSYPLEGKTISVISTASSSTAEGKNTTEEASQELYSVQKDENSPEFNSPPDTSTPFVQSKKECCLQLSGESVSSQPSYLYACSKPELSSSPTALSKFTLTSSSSSGDERKKILIGNIQVEPEMPSLEIPMWCQKELQLEESASLEEEGTPEESGAVSCSFNGIEKAEEFGQNLSMSGEDIFSPPESERLPLSQAVSQKLNLELSQDFSQVANRDFQNLCLSPQPEKQVSPSTSKIETEISGKTFVKRKYSDEDEGEINRKKIKGKFETFLKENQISKESLLQVITEEDTKCEEVTKSKQPTSTLQETEQKCSKETNSPEIKESSKVFALWGDGYYSGTVEKLSANMSVTVLFDDGERKVMPAGDVFTDEIFPHGQSVCVKLNDTYYVEATVIFSPRMENDVYYAVKTRNGAYHLVPRASLSFTKAQWRIYKGVSVERKQTGKTRKSKTADYAEPLSTDTSSSSKVQKKIFDGITFLITSEAKTAPDTYSPCLDSHLEDEEDALPIDKAALITLLMDNGGSYLDKLHRRKLARNKIVCITNKVCKTYKFLYCVVVGIPVVDIQWVYDGIEKQKLQDYKKYVVPAGKDITGIFVNQNFSAPGKKKRHPYTPLTILRIFVHQSTKQRICNRDLDLVLQCLGCERVCSGNCLSNLSKKLPFTINCLDYILSLTDKIPDILWEQAQQAEIPVVTVEWLFQCIINNRLMDLHDTPAFIYKHRNFNQVAS